MQSVTNDGKDGAPNPQREELEKGNVADFNSSEASPRQPVFQIASSAAAPAGDSTTVDPRPTAYKFITTQNRLMHNQIVAYRKIIHGAAIEAVHASIEQLLAEAGDEGLRAKALEMDSVRPALSSIRGIFGETGGTNVMGQMIAEIHTLRAEVNELRSKRAHMQQIEHAKDDFGEPVKIRQQQPSTASSTACASSTARTTSVLGANATGTGTLRAGVSGAAGFAAAALPTIPPSIPDGIVPGVATAINPERARLLSMGPPNEGDPDYDLYAAIPAVTRPLVSKGSNNIPLGPPRKSKSLVHGNHERNSRKRRQRLSQQDPAKRPHISTAMIAGTRAQCNVSLHPNDGLHRLAGPVEPFIKQEEGPDTNLFNAPVARGQQAYNASIVAAGDRSFGFPPNTFPSFAGGPTGQGSWDIFFRPRSEVPARLESASFGVNISPGDSSDVFISRCPIALWCGASDAIDLTGPGLIKAGKISAHLGRYLADAARKCLAESKRLNWGEGLPFSDNCILHNAANGRAPAQRPIRRACLSRPSNQPCAVVQRIGDARTVIFLPLMESRRHAGSCWELGYWM